MGDYIYEINYWPSYPFFSSKCSSFLIRCIINYLGSANSIEKTLSDNVLTIRKSFWGEHPIVTARHFELCFLL